MQSSRMSDYIKALGRGTTDQCRGELRKQQKKQTHTHKQTQWQPTLGCKDFFFSLWKTNSIFKLTEQKTSLNSDRTTEHFYDYVNWAIPCRSQVSYESVPGRRFYLFRTVDWKRHWRWLMGQAEGKRHFRQNPRVLRCPVELNVGSEDEHTHRTYTEWDDKNCVKVRIQKKTLEYGCLFCSSWLLIPRVLKINGFDVSTKTEQKLQLLVI